jgi:hypothetical protein
MPRLGFGTMYLVCLGNNLGIIVGIKSLFDMTIVPNGLPSHNVVAKWVQIHTKESIGLFYKRIMSPF